MKLDSCVKNTEVNINGYSIIRNDKNRNSGGVAYYIRNDLYFNIKNIFSNSIELAFFEILIPKLIVIRIFYRPPNANDFLDIFSNDFQQVDNKTNGIYLLGDFNINLFQFQNLFSKKISHMNSKIIFFTNISQVLGNFFPLIHVYLT